MTARVAPSAASWRMLCRRTASMELRSLSWSSDWARLSPLLHAHSNRLGRYSFAIPYIVAGGGRRSLCNLTVPILNRTFRPDVPKTPTTAIERKRCRGPETDCCQDEDRTASPDQPESRKVTRRQEPRCERKTAHGVAGEGG